MYSIKYTFDNEETVTLSNFKSLPDVLTDFSASIQKTTEGAGQFKELHESFQYERISIVFTETGQEIASFVGLSKHPKLDALAKRQFNWADEAWNHYKEN